MTKVSVYLVNGVVKEFNVSSPDKAREHAYQIIMTGYRSTSEGSTDLEWYPPHQILKIKIKGGAEGTQYHDRSRST